MYRYLIYFFRHEGCGKVFPKRKGWLKHDLTHMAKRVCGYCGIAVSSHHLLMCQGSLFYILHFKKRGEGSNLRCKQTVKL